MKIAISTLVTPSRYRGIGNYIINLLKALQETDQDNEYLILRGEDTKRIFNLYQPNFQALDIPFRHNPRWLMRPLYFIWQNSVAQFVLRRSSIDVLHIPNLVPLVRSYVPTVVTIPDLTEHYVRNYSGLRQYYRSSIPRMVASNAARIITISNSSKNDLINITGIAPSKVDVTYLASSIPNIEGPLENSTIIGVKNKYGLKRDYLLYVGSFLPHKNLERLVRGYCELRHQNKINQLLVLAGADGNYESRLRGFVAQEGMESEIRFLGYVPSEELPPLYKCATAFVFPSINEGFGLPILEAMSCGTPVLTSNISSLSEIAGEAGYFVDPFSIQSIEDGILALVEDEQLRQRLITSGHERANEFSWESCARDTLASYQRAAS